MLQEIVEKMYFIEAIPPSALSVMLNENTH